MLSATTTVTYRDVRNLTQWTTSLSYVEIRDAEVPQHAVFSDGRRLRGVSITAGLCLARDGMLYCIRNGVAAPCDLRALLTEYTMDDIQRLITRALTPSSSSSRDRH